MDDVSELLKSVSAGSVKKINVPLDLLKDTTYEGYANGRVGENGDGYIIEGDSEVICTFGDISPQKGPYKATIINGRWIFKNAKTGRNLMCIPYRPVTDIFSRNTGLFDCEMMLKKKVIMVGCGSAGSLALCELARLGVGHFMLIDADVLELHNICRHQLGISSVGMYKVNAMKCRMLDINPHAEIRTYTCPIERINTKELFKFIDDENTIMISTADSRKVTAFCSDIAESFKIPFVTFGCWTRAAAGEVYWWLPDIEGMVSYREAFSQMIEEDPQERHPLYIGQDEDINNLSFEPGVSTDMSMITLVGVKVASDLLNLNEADYTLRVIRYLGQYALICNTNKENIGGSSVTMFNHPLQVIRANLGEQR